MTVADIVAAARPTATKIWIAIAVAVLALAALDPAAARDTALFVLNGFVHVAPLVAIGITLAAWILASGASDRVAAIFQGRTVQTVIAATVVGAISPVCGVTVLPLMAGLLSAGVPLAPVMAFWLASPITGPELLSVTAATLGWQFMLGKAAAAIFLGLVGGAVTAIFAGREWARSPLRRNGLAKALSGGCAPCGDSEAAFEPRIWRDPARRARFVREALSIIRLMLIVLTPAFAAEYWLNALLQPDALASYVGRDNPFAIPLTVLIGAPAYVDGYAALPLTRALMDHGMSAGAAMAFLVSGGVVSIWGAMAIFPVIRFKPFLLYLVLAIVLSMLSGWGFGAVHTV